MPRKPINGEKDKNNGPSSMEIAVNGVKSILDRKHENLVFNVLFSAVDKVVASGKKKELGQSLDQLTKKCFSDWLTELKVQTGNPLISLLSANVDSLNVYINLIPKMFGHYDSAVPPEQSTRTIIRNNFNDIIYSNKDTMDSVARAMLDSFLMFRKRSDTDYSIVKNLVTLFYDFKDYLSNDRFETFKNDLEENTLNFYEEVFQTKFGDSMVDYLNVCKDYMEYETKILESIFRPVEAKDISSVAFSALISSNQDRFYQGFVPTISQALTCESLEPLKWYLEMFNHFGIDSSDLVKALTEFIKNQMLTFKSLFLPPEAPKKDAAGKKTVTKKVTKKKADDKKDGDDKKDADDKKEGDDGEEKKEAAAPAKKGVVKKVVKKAPAKKEGEEKTVTTPENVKHMEELIHRTIELSTNFKAVFSEVKDANKTLESAIKVAWNAKEFNVQSNFVIFCDYHLRNEMKYLSQKDIESFPQICKEFVNRTEDKEVFRKAYESYLIRRIIKQGEKNKKMEESIIKEIRKIIQEFVKNFENYYKRVKESKEELDRFILEQGAQKVPFNPIIFKNQEFTLTKEEVKFVPQFLSEINDKFSAYYANFHKNSKLTLLADLSTIEFRFFVPPNLKSPTPRTYTISCDIICGAILNTIATLKTPTLLNIYQAAQFKHDEIKGYIKRLCAKERPLIVRVKEEADKGNPVLQETDKFQLNPKFFFKTLFVQVPPVDKNTEKIQQDASKNKDFIMKAAGVRCLKQRNIVTRAELENEITQQAQQFFRPQIDQVRAVIRMLQFDDSEVFCKELDDGRLQYIK